MFTCSRTVHPNEESARTEAKRLSDTLLPDYDRPIEHEAYVCIEHFGKWHVRIKDPSLAKEARQAKMNALKVQSNRSHYKFNGQEKRTHNSMREAMAQARMLELKEGAAMKAYQCGECHLWHIGHAENSGITPRKNEEMLETQQKTIGYSVSTKPTPSLPMRPLAAPANRFAEAAAKLQQISQQIATREKAIKRKTDESKRLAEMAMALFNQAAEAESQGKTLEVEVQTLAADVGEMKGQAQSIMRELNQAFAA